ncbi:type VI secretion system baseplate subunit TssG [Hymenobacter volaticus]|uniref:Type VI secretion system baseplate subunit TssG n=1 Tax=Hymenobacter volaticus TaxID=2932254 RepID=A0ABY4GD67_9BACT|nr:type VI secretion system baseplate subunit TssG [Hymenobacter volaticus]UOQ68865.1 type VI secretion system baseplate subunit TssG [Hymenobacter volaticus]
MPNLSLSARLFGPPPAASARPNSPVTGTSRRLLEQLRRQPFDLRLEVVLADLLAHGYSFDDFVVRPVSLFARRYRRDIGAVSEEAAEQQWRAPKTVVEVHREGLYDALPQQVFHHAGDPAPTPGVRAMIADIQAQRRREKATRRFFLPFEQEFYRFRVLLEQEERRYMTNLSAQWYNEVLARFWEIAGQLPPRQVTTLLYLLPLAHGIVGDLPRTQQVFECVLEVPVRLRTITPLRFAAEDLTEPGAALGTVLGQGELGRDFVLSGAYQETLPALEVRLPSLSTTLLAAFLAPDNWQARALKLLCNYFVAFETDVVFHYEVAAASQSFVLADEGETAILGYTTSGL